jgi:2'-deoxynucleoside 5'-phosphate N-hydrolase
MKIYFAGSIRGGREDAALYKSIIDYLSQFGEVLTEHVGDASLSAIGDDGPNDRFIYDRDMRWLSECDFVVAEASTPSLGVGYELGQSVAQKKLTLCLYRSGLQWPISAMITGNPALKTAEYSSFDDIIRIVREFMDEIP